MATPNIPQIYDLQMNRLCFLDKATEIGYKMTYNGLWTAQFTLPADDPKNEYCDPFHFVEIYDGTKRIELFRILPSTLSRADTGYITYQCEHVIATLIDNILFKYHQIGNIGVYTTQALRYVLDRQKTKHWQLGKCDFTRQFEYKWENENLLSSLFSIPKPFDVEYHWTYDTTTYPWLINLVKPETEIGCEIRYQKNMQSIEKNVDPTNLVTRIYPLGYGEGDNQLTIESINGGIPYLEADTISTYGLKETVWADTRFEDATSLKETARAMLDNLKTPYISYTVESIDLFEKTNQSFDEFLEGKLIRVSDRQDKIDFNARVIEVSKSDVTNSDISVTIANKPQDVAGTISDLQERARINSTYAQGATNQLMVNYADNADNSNPAVLKLYIPDSMVRINKCVLNFELEAFRGYTKSLSTAEQTTQSTSTKSSSSNSTQSGGDTVSSTDSASVNVPSTETGGYSTPSSTAVILDSKNIINDDQGGANATNHNHGIGKDVQLITSVNFDTRTTKSVGWFPSGAHIHGLHKHDIIIEKHKHDLIIPSHSHEFEIPSHSHEFEIPSHGHTVIIPAHTHEMEFGIYQGGRANSVSIRIDGRIIPISTGDIDIVKYLSTDNSGKINRNTWHTIELIPSSLTRITANIFMQIFTNSRGGGDF